MERMTRDAIDAHPTTKHAGAHRAARLMAHPNTLQSKSGHDSSRGSSVSIAPQTRPHIFERDELP